MKPFDTSTANNLLEPLMDSVRGFEAVNEGTHTFGLYSYSSRRAVQRRDIAERLFRQVSRYGIRIEPHGSTLGALHRLFLAVKNFFVGSKRSTVRELVRGETYLLHRVEVMLASVALPEDVAAIVRELHVCVSDSKLELTRLGAATRKQRGWKIRAG